MFAFILRRTIQSIVVLFVMSLLVFCMINLVGDPVDMLVNPESLPDEIERVRRRSDHCRDDRSAIGSLCGAQA